MPRRQQEVNGMYFAIGLLCYNILKLMQQEVLPKPQTHQLVSTLRDAFFHLVNKVTKSARQPWTPCI